MIKEDIKPGYAPKEISFGGYTTKNLHHSADAARAFQDTIERVGKRYPADVLSALKHTDDYMKLNDLHLEQGKAPDEAELKAWRHAHTEARNMLNKVGEFMHHEDYWHMHEHEIQDLETNFTPAAVGAEMTDSFKPEGEMLPEELTDKTIKSGDKIKVARVIADMLGVDNAESMSPDVAVNTGLRKVKNKRMTPELVGVVKKMLALASEVGIKVDQSLVPKAVSEETITELKRDTLKSYIAKSMGSKSAADFTRGVKMAQGSGGEDELRAKSEKRSAGIHTAIKKLTKEQASAANDDKTAPEEDEKDTIENVPTQVGHTMQHPADDQLRRRKVMYKLGEWVEMSESELNEVSDQTLDKAWHGRYQQALAAKHGSPEHQKAHKSMGKIGDVMKKRIDNKLMHMAKHDPEAYKKSAVDSAEQDRKRGWSTESFDSELSEAADKVTIHMPGYPLHGKEASVFHRFDDGRVNAQVRHSMKKGDISNFTLKKDQYKEVAKEEVELEEGVFGDPVAPNKKSELQTLEDLQSADYKVSASGRKYRARHINFAASGANANPEEGDDNDGKKAVRKAKSSGPLLKPVKEEVEQDVEMSDDELEKLAKTIDTEDDVLDAYEDDELVIVDDETGEVVSDIKEECEQINEVLSRAERMRAKVRFARTSSKRERRMKIVLKTRSSSATINKRARRLAVNLLKQRIMKKPASQLTIGEKERVERMLAKRKNLINRLSMKLAPRVRKIENERLSHSKVTK